MTPLPVDQKTQKTIWNPKPRWSEPSRVPQNGKDRRLMVEIREREEVKKIFHGVAWHCQSVSPFDPCLLLDLSFTDRAWNVSSDFWPKYSHDSISNSTITTVQQYYNRHSYSHKSTAVALVAVTFTPQKPQHEECCDMSLSDVALFLFICCQGLRLRHGSSGGAVAVRRRRGRGRRFHWKGNHEILLEYPNGMHS